MAAYAALASLAKITNLNQNQVNYPSSDVDVEADIRSIHEYVIFLLSFLEEFPEKSRRWEGKMRDAAHETEDVIEQLMWQHHRRMIVSSKMQEQLRIVKRELGIMAGETMEERPARIGAAAVSPSSPTGNDAVVGLHKDILEIKERLCGYPLNLQVIPIVGMGGIGKTTLAKTIYDDQLIIEHFDIRAWVVVSQDYSPIRFRKSLLDSMKLIGGKEMDESDIELKVFKTFKGMRYLVVIDDVWGTHVWG